MDFESLKAECPEGVVDHGGDLRLVHNVQAAVADHVDIRLVEFPEAPPLGPLSPVDLADLITAEGEGQLSIVGSHIFCQRHGEVKTQGKVALALGETVNLLLCLPAALGQQHLCRFNHRRVEGREAVGGVG